MATPIVDPRALALSYVGRLHEAQERHTAFPDRDFISSEREEVREELLRILSESKTLAPSQQREVFTDVDRALRLPPGHMEWIQRAVASALEYEQQLEALLDQLRRG